MRVKKPAQKLLPYTAIISQSQGVTNNSKLKQGLSKNLKKSKKNIGGDVKLQKKLKIEKYRKKLVNSDNSSATDSTDDNDEILIEFLRNYNKNSATSVDVTSLPNISDLDSITEVSGISQSSTPKKHRRSKKISLRKEEITNGIQCSIKERNENEIINGVVDIKDSMKRRSEKLMKCKLNGQDESICNDFDNESDLDETMRTKLVNFLANKIDRRELNESFENNSSVSVLIKDNQLQKEKIIAQRQQLKIKRLKRKLECNMNGNENQIDIENNVEHCNETYVKQDSDINKPEDIVVDEKVKRKIERQLHIDVTDKYNFVKTSTRTKLRPKSSSLNDYEIAKRLKRNQFRKLKRLNNNKKKNFSHLSTLNKNHFLGFDKSIKRFKDEKLNSDKIINRSYFNFDGYLVQNKIVHINETNSASQNEQVDIVTFQNETDFLLFALVNKKTELINNYKLQQRLKHWTNMTKTKQNHSTYNDINNISTNAFHMSKTLSNSNENLSKYYFIENKQISSSGINCDVINKTLMNCDKNNILFQVPLDSNTCYLNINQNEINQWDIQNNKQIYETPYNLYQNILFNKEEEEEQDVERHEKEINKNPCNNKKKDIHENFNHDNTDEIKINTKIENNILNENTIKQNENISFQKINKSLYNQNKQKLNEHVGTHKTYQTDKNICEEIINNDNKDVIKDIIIKNNENNILPSSTDKLNQKDIHLFEDIKINGTYHRDNKETNEYIYSNQHHNEIKIQNQRNINEEHTKKLASDYLTIKRNKSSTTQQQTHSWNKRRLQNMNNKNQRNNKNELITNKKYLLTRNKTINSVIQNGHRQFIKNNHYNKKDKKITNIKMNNDRKKILRNKSIKHKHIVISENKYEQKNSKKLIKSNKKIENSNKKSKKTDCLSLTTTNIKDLNSSGTGRVSMYDIIKTKNRKNSKKCIDESIFFRHENKEDEIYYSIILNNNKNNYFFNNKYMNLNKSNYLNKIIFNNNNIKNKKIFNYLLKEYFNNNYYLNIINKYLKFFLSQHQQLHNRFYSIEKFYKKINKRNLDIINSSSTIINKKNKINNFFYNILYNGPIYFNIIIFKLIEFMMDLKHEKLLEN